MYLIYIYIFPNGWINTWNQIEKVEASRDLKGFFWGTVLLAENNLIHVQSDWVLVAMPMSGIWYTLSQTPLPSKFGHRGKMAFSASWFQNSFCKNDFWISDTFYSFPTAIFSRRVNFPLVPSGLDQTRYKLPVAKERSKYYAREECGLVSQNSRSHGPPGFLLWLRGTEKPPNLQVSTRHHWIRRLHLSQKC